MQFDSNRRASGTQAQKKSGTRSARFAWGIGLYRQPARSNTFWARAVFVDRVPTLSVSDLKGPRASSAGFFVAAVLTTGHSLLPSAK